MNKKMAKLLWGGCNYHYLCMIIYFSSPFLFVFGDDRMTCHTGTNVNLGEDIDA